MFCKVFLGYLAGYIGLHRACADGDLEKVKEITGNKDDLEIDDTQVNIKHDLQIFWFGEKYFF